MLSNAHVPILGFAAWSGTGKTTLLLGLVPLLRERGLRLGVLKHAHHGFDVDQPGKDSYELRKAGAAQMLVASRERWALMVETEGLSEPQLDRLLLELDQAALDLILVEGFRHEHFPKIEVHRPALGKPLLHPSDEDIIAIAADAPPAVPVRVPLLALNDTSAVADFIIRRLAQAGS